ncbi:outer membrane receptor for ferric coprogen and ferric-rhodotorulic acid [Novosphingobium chloroacetimidivorans]|uniref:Outer membrane receptor for ferric coprogen and ferric-rhodotorulic acid n=1 Tax=Novosphingobium chloroacetimidivorans TaxID=1428314 RepID=A0A7W7KET4_9SPHN|nr:hypothetical protein [Novosphingobium chloroacetimidivorans]MBB4860893.1 outer membrane receptor for ferric coprogen and ferric-rhodotorulic acid [Novosphingobium chloroacetimidivorans]
MEFQATANAPYASFDHLGFDADVSVPITSDGSIRARTVGGYGYGDSYLGRHHLRR